MLGLVSPNLEKEALIVEMESGPNDLHLEVLYTFLLTVWIKIEDALGFFGRLSLDCFRLGFLTG
jgi:hypothetical protein